MKNKELFESIGKHKQIFAIGFDLTDLEDGTQDAEIRSYVEFDGITTTDAMKVIGDIIGRLIRDASKKSKTRSEMVKTLIVHIVKEVGADDDKPEAKRETKPKTKPEKPEDDDIRKIADTLESIKTLLEVVKMVKED